MKIGVDSNEINWKEFDFDRGGYQSRENRCRFQRGIINTTFYEMRRIKPVKIGVDPNADGKQAPALEMLYQSREKRGRFQRFLG